MGRRPPPKRTLQPFYLVDGLYAVCEGVAGVHGANRLGGNSLAETVAIDKLVGEHIATAIDGSDADPSVTDEQRAPAEREFRALEEGYELDYHHLE